MSEHPFDGSPAATKKLSLIVRKVSRIAMVIRKTHLVCKTVFSPTSIDERSRIEDTCDSANRQTSSFAHLLFLFWKVTEQPMCMLLVCLHTATVSPLWYTRAQSKPSFENTESSEQYLQIDKKGIKHHSTALRDAPSTATDTSPLKSTAAKGATLSLSITLTRSSPNDEINRSAASWLEWPTLGTAWGKG